MAAQDQTHLLQSRDQLKLLDEIDKLRSQGISHYVSLPQLIVCGDQSSGKSSVLEAISGITFPAKDNLCTRFATEVILRKASAVSIAVRIIPSKLRSPGEEAKLKEFGDTFQDLDQFAPLVDKAKDIMGISDTSGAFSNDVLRVEISGPDRPHLTIVDLPGLIHSENKLQSAADVTLVWDMVRGYMENKRSIILAVVSAKNDYANQAVLKLAKEVDAEGTRTLGVITKPDTLSVGSDSEAGFVSLSLNEDIHFRLGWHIVRNRNYEERSASTAIRNGNESAFFARGVWKDLPRTMVGIDSLRARLSKVLLDQIKAELPALVDDIQSNLEDCETKLNKLGSKRTTLGEQRLFLLHIGQAFQALSRAAVNGMYEDTFFGESRSDMGYAKRLRAVVANLNLDFAKTMRMHGHHRRIVEGQSNEPTYNLRSGKVVSRADFEAEILELLKSSRGRELPGMFNPMIVGEIFHQQAKPWENIARDHVQQTWEAVRAFLSLALASLTDDNTFEGLLREVVDPLMQERLKSVNNKLDEVLLPHVRGHPITYNHYFTETIQNMRQQRQKQELTERLSSLYNDNSHKNKAFSFNNANGDSDWTGSFKFSELLSALTTDKEADMDKYACSEILLCMEAYYKVAMKVLVDNVAVQAIEACLMTHLPEIISPASVVQMEDDVITRIAAEPEENQALREQLTHGLSICNRYNGRRTGTIVNVTEQLARIAARSEKTTDLGSDAGLDEVIEHVFQEPEIPLPDNIDEALPRPADLPPPVEIEPDYPAIEDPIISEDQWGPVEIASTSSKKGRKRRSFKPREVDFALEESSAPAPAAAAYDWQ